MILLNLSFLSGINHVLARTRRPACLLRIPFVSSFSALAATLLCLWAPSNLYSEIESTEYDQSTAGSPLVLYRGMLELPSLSEWKLVSAPQDDSLRTLFIEAQQTPSLLPSGNRIQTVNNERLIETPRSALMQLVRFSVNASQLDERQQQDPSYQRRLERQLENIEKQTTTTPWHELRENEIEGPFFFLIPEPEYIYQDGVRLVEAADKRPVAFELRPYQDDGMHWVGYTNGTAERVAIDTNLVDADQQSIRPLTNQEKGIASNDEPPQRLHKLYASSKGKIDRPLTLSLQDLATGEIRHIEWDLSQASPADSSLEEDYNRSISSHWLSKNSHLGSPVLEYWANTKTDNSAQSARMRQMQIRANQGASLLQLFNGRVAIAETLQLDPFQASPSQSDETVAIDTIEGVEVKPHPFEEMLGDAKVDTIEVATVVPPDRFFLYLGKPQALFATLDTALETLNEIRGAASGDIRDYHLKEKYLERLGLNEAWIQSLLGSGSVQDAALYTTDLLIADSTDLTVCIRLKNLKPIKSLLSVLGLSTKGGRTILSIPTANGQETHWALSGDFLFCSTLKSEIERSLALLKNDGRDSLGRTHEFRYMLSKLPASERTRGWAYFSDPFIRKTTSPADKIRQLRREQHKQRLQQLTAAALLAKLEGSDSDLTVAQLKALNYLPETFPENNYSLSPDLVAQSEPFGSLDDLAPLSAYDVAFVTRSEARTYESFRENYSRYWRMFFDPIAIRLDESEDQSLTAETFILPLIDSTLYEELRSVLQPAETESKLSPIAYAETPLLNLSLNLTEKSWLKITKDFSRFLQNYTQISPELFDHLGPAIHFSVLDASPVLANGSGELTGLIGSSFGGRNNSRGMALLPIAIAALTQPCKLAIETTDIEKVRTLLRAKISSSQNELTARQELRVKFLQIGDQDRWTLSLNVMGMISIRYGIEIKDNHLIISNIPWLDETHIEETNASSLNGARFQLWPEAAQRQLPALHAAAAERAGEAALLSAEALYPLLASGYSSLETVYQDHKKLFGTEPRHPQGGEYSWDGYALSSSQYGTPSNKTRPPYQEGDRDFGLFSHFETFSVEMQFEQDGLRTRMTWKLSDN